MIKNLSHIPLALLLFFTTTATHAQTTVTTQPVDATTTLINLNLELDPNECVYKDYIDFSVDNPAIELVGWESTTEPETQYDLTFKENKKVYKNKVALTVKAHHTDTQHHTANLHFSYYRTRDKAITQEIVPMAFNTPPADLAPTAPALGYAVDAHNTDITEAAPTSTPAPQPATRQSQSWSEYVTQLVKKSDSLLLRLLFVFLLGILVSLTPCIYPMIPITIGVLQSQGQRSLLRNFVTAFSYVTGIATTFALLGVLAAFTGQVFGTIMSHPITILIIVALLIYLALSMLGLYEMYVPRSLASSNTHVKGGSLISAFIFGAISGSVASPCLSPGLILLLSIVTTLGSKLIGFALLFAFGLGLGLPLLIIGTFSNALQLLPRAGMWMVEVKRLFGFIQLGMCFYFLSALIPACILLWALMAFVFAVGMFYLYDMHHTHSTVTKNVKACIGVALIATAVVIAAYAYKATCQVNEIAYEQFWKTDYPQALAQAQQENKKMLVYVGAKFCSICSAIDNTVFKNPRVCDVLAPCITIKVDGSESTNPAFTQLKKKYNIMGFPTYLLIDPVEDKLLRQWGSELYDTEHEIFAQELEKHLK